MKILSQDTKKGFFKIQAESLDDLWCLANIISKGDIIKSRTARKIRIETSSERGAATQKKTFVLALQVEKTELKESQLRVSGKITEAPDDVPRGSYHTINIDENTTFSLTKQNLLHYQLNQLKEQSRERQTSIMIVAIDREEAAFALLKKYGYKMLSEIKGDVEKKYARQQLPKEFYGEVIRQVEEYVRQYRIQHLILGSIAFWKDELYKRLNPELKKITILAACSTSGENAINELLKREELRQALKEERAARELNLVEELLREISKEQNYAYGLKDVAAAIESGAIKTLLVSQNLIRKQLEKDRFSELNELMQKAERQQGEVAIITTKEAQKQLDGLGGIAAMLRFKLYY